MVELSLQGDVRDGNPQVARLDVRWMASGEIACVVDATPSMTIEDFRSQVLERTAVPVEQQKLFCEGKELLHQADFQRVGFGSTSMSCKPFIQLVCCHSDPRNTNRAHFRGNLNYDGPVGSFRKMKKIGTALYGEVATFKWSPDGLDEAEVAVKCISMQKARPTLDKDTNEWTAHQSSLNVPPPEDAYAEIGVLQYLSKQPDLPNFLLKLLATFVQDSTIMLVMELADGGELLEAVLSQKLLDTSLRRRYLWQTLQAVKYLHAHYIGHRDVSLENLLLKGDESVVLVDFGNAVQSHSSTGQELRYFLTVGKDSYRGPECVVPRKSRVPVVVPDKAGPEDIIMHRESGGLGALYQVRLPKGASRGQICQAEVWGYGVQPADIFSCGVCFFAMSYGSCPWIKAELSDELFHHVYTNKDTGLKDLLRHWGKAFLEAEAMELLLSMLRIDPLTRPSAVGCLKSRWFGEEREDDEML